MEDLTGMQLGAYRIVAALGEGGMASVYKAYQPGIDRYVAVKVLPRQLAQNPQFVERFTREAKLIARLIHPHILPIHDFGSAEGYTYLVMPFVEGGTLTRVLTGQPLPFSQTLSLITQLADALDYAHSLGIVHRDIKPSNVLIDPRGNCLLTDFGIARMVEAVTPLTQAGAIVGTPAYMSPEQGRGERVDQRSDIYSLGVMLYEMVTGRVPFDAETPVAVIFKHIQDPLPPPRALNRDLPEAVERVIFKAMAKDPGDRHQTAGEMARALQAAGAAVSPSPRQPAQAPPLLAGAMTPGSSGTGETLRLSARPASAGARVTILLIGAAVLVVLLMAGGTYALAPVVRTMVAPRGTTPAVTTNRLEPTSTPPAETPRPTTGPPRPTATLPAPTPRLTEPPFGTAQPLASPDGFHDGSEGIVDTSNCNAFGWAVDPDNRSRHVQVRVLVDGNEVASGNASDYGEDMDRLGICPGGTCRFTMSLLGLISTGESHLVTAQAYDEETATWLDLSGTPKSLACQPPPAANART